MSATSAAAAGNARRAVVTFPYVSLFDKRQTRKPPRPSLAGTPVMRFKGENKNCHGSDNGRDGRGSIMFFDEPSPLCTSNRKFVTVRHTCEMLVALAQRQSPTSRWAWRLERAHAPLKVNIRTLSISMKPNKWYSKHENRYGAKTKIDDHRTAKSKIVKLSRPSPFRTHKRGDEVQTGVAENLLCCNKRGTEADADGSPVVIKNANIHLNTSEF
ncbi:hypothetical protein EVAR_47769_1 [Eumeta japonica]|uniref:Uncharacterized protein n=1 Tax=Eumeta variegata TaxID=151549 RepID=A0A4C1XUJ1_EUMVA|nr:hypothetical protein EVAR_47769_1 [Eumeta japonica]